MIKNIIITVTILMSLVTSSYAQNISLDLENTKNVDQEMVTKYKDIELTIGSLKIHAPFLYKGEFSPYQGYLIKFKDYMRLHDIVVGSQKSNESLISTIQKGYDAKLFKCQSDCDLRVKSLQNDKDLLILENKALVEKVQSIKTSRIIWTISSAVVGAGLGVLVYEISK